MPTIFRRTIDANTVHLGVRTNGEFQRLATIYAAQPDNVHTRGYDSFETLRRMQIVNRDLNCSVGFICTLNVPLNSIPEFPNAA